MRLSKAESVAPEWHLLETIKNLQTPKSEFGALDGPRERQNRGLSQFHTLETISVQKRYSVAGFRGPNSAFEGRISGPRMASFRDYKKSPDSKI